MTGVTKVRVQDSLRLVDHVAGVHVKKVCKVHGVAKCQGRSEASYRHRGHGILEVVLRSRVVGELDDGVCVEGTAATGGALDVDLEAGDPAVTEGGVRPGIERGHGECSDLEGGQDRIPGHNVGRGGEDGRLGNGSVAHAPVGDRITRGVGITALGTEVRLALVPMNREVIHCILPYASWHVPLPTPVRLRVIHPRHHPCLVPDLGPDRASVGGPQIPGSIVIKAHQ
mmetsp:Transcript_8681/g.11513  ORF Transcript_8681/g.11513 Transcript_8681/m.11513 type:complete len:227 (-) Transcript_8681:460-1140(-)